MVVFPFTICLLLICFAATGSRRKHKQVTFLCENRESTLKKKKKQRVKFLTCRSHLSKLCFFFLVTWANCELWWREYRWLRIPWTLINSYVESTCLLRILSLWLNSEGCVHPVILGSISSFCHLNYICYSFLDWRRCPNLYFFSFRSDFLSFRVMYFFHDIVVCQFSLFSYDL